MVRTGRFSVGNGGWICYRAADIDEPIFVRVRRADDGRFVMCDLYVPFDTPPDARKLRDVADRAGSVEIAANDPQLRDDVEARLGLPAPDLRTAATYYATTFGRAAGRSPDWMVRMFASQVEGTDEPKVKPKRLPAKPDAPEAADLTINLPDTRPYSDSFYRQVGERYAAAAVRSDRPAADLAETNDVPVKTVHRWVAKARDLGFLAPGRQGRAG